MRKPSDITVLEAQFSTEPCPFRAPLKFGGRIVQGVELLNVWIRVRNPAGEEAIGLGSMPLGNVWAWPSSAVSTEASAAAIRDLTATITRAAEALTDFAHPLDHVHTLSGNYRALAAEACATHAMGESMPALAVLLAASPVDAALHDAFGKVNRINAFNGLSQEFVHDDLSYYLNAEFSGEYLDRYTKRELTPKMPLYHLVGALDPITPADVAQPIGDGLPESLAPWIQYNGLTHLKIKLNGDDLAWDVERVVAVEATAAQAQQARGCDTWHYSLDFNEKCANVGYVLEFLHKVGERAPSALDRVQYIEQPTHRDLKAHPHNRMHEAARIKPVVIDESLVDFESLCLAREQGYSGVALKACKGHSEALLMGAAAQKFGMFLCVQDLTCPGASFLHSAELAARIPGVAAIEGNGRQYCPKGNDHWRERFPSMFQITDGSVGTFALNGIGLGH